MKQLIIGLDIDGVIVDYFHSILPLISGILGKPIDYEDITHPALTKFLDIDEETATNIWDTILETDLLLESPPVEGALEGLRLLYHHRIWLITGRPELVRGVTLSWLYKNGINFEEIFFKSAKAADFSSPERECNLFVEDQLEIACRFAEAGINTLLLNQPWNRTSSLPENCDRVYNWNEIIDIISRLETDI